MSDEIKSPGMEDQAFKWDLEVEDQASKPLKEIHGALEKFLNGIERATQEFRKSQQDLNQVLETAAQRTIQHADAQRSAAKETRAAQRVAEDLGEQVKEGAEQVKDLDQADKELKETVQELSKATGGLTEALEEVQSTVETAAESAENLDETIKENTKSVKDAGGEYRRLIGELKNVTNQLREMGREGLQKATSLVDTLTSSFTGLSIAGMLSIGGIMGAFLKAAHTMDRIKRAHWDLAAAGAASAGQYREAALVVERYTRHLGFEREEVAQTAVAQVRLAKGLGVVKEDFGRFIKDYTSRTLLMSRATGMSTGSVSSLVEHLVKFNKLDAHRGVDRITNAFTFLIHKAGLTGDALAQFMEQGKETFQVLGLTGDAAERATAEYASIGAALKRAGIQAEAFTSQLHTIAEGTEEGYEKAANWVRLLDTNVEDVMQTVREGRLTDFFSQMSAGFRKMNAEIEKTYSREEDRRLETRIQLNQLAQQFQMPVDELIKYNDLVKQGRDNFADLAKAAETAGKEQRVMQEAGGHAQMTTAQQMDAIMERVDASIAGIKGVLPLMKSLGTTMADAIVWGAKKINEYWPSIKETIDEELAKLKAIKQELKDVGKAAGAFQAGDLVPTRDNISRGAESVDEIWAEVFGGKQAAEKVKKDWARRRAIEEYKKDPEGTRGMKFEGVPLKDLKEPVQEEWGNFKQGDLLHIDPSGGVSSLEPVPDHGSATPLGGDSSAPLAAELRDPDFKNLLAQQVRATREVANQVAGLRAESRGGVNRTPITPAETALNGMLG